MKNIHVLATDKPSRLKQNKITKKISLVNKGIDLTSYTPNIYITSEEIKEGDKDFYIIANDRDKTWINRLEKVVECKIDPKHGKVLILFSETFLWVDEGKKIILTTDQDLIADGVQSIPDEFLKWFCKNPSCEYVEVELDYDNDLRIIDGKNLGYYCIIPKEECTCKIGQPYNNACCKVHGSIPKEGTLEEAAECKSHHSEEDFIRGAQWQQEQDKKLYSEEEVLELLRKAHFVEQNIDEWFEQFKK